MYMNAGYLHNSLIDFKDKTRPLVVGSCGTYRLYNRPKLPTYRPRGRLDFQILYVTAGKAHFFLDEEYVEVTAGHMVPAKGITALRILWNGSDRSVLGTFHRKQCKKYFKRIRHPSDRTCLLHRAVSRIPESVSENDPRASNMQPAL